MRTRTRRKPHDDDVEIPDHRYDPDHPYWHAFSRADNIVMKVLRRRDFWTLFTAAIVVRLFVILFNLNLDLQHITDDSPQFGQLIVFLIVFFNSVCYQRFMDSYAQTNECLSLVIGIASFASTGLRTPRGGLNVTRYALALFHVLIYEARGETHWQTLKVRQALTDEEIDRLAAMGERSCAGDVILGWALAETRHAWVDGDALPSPVGAHLVDRLLRLYSSLHRLKSVVRLPVVLSYYQVLNFQVYLFLAVVALSEACDRDKSFMRFAVATFITQVVFLSVRELSIMLADPYGDDPSDTDLDWYLWAAAVRVARLMDGCDVPHGSAETDWEAWAAERQGRAPADVRRGFQFPSRPDGEPAAGGLDSGSTGQPVMGAGPHARTVEIIPLEREDAARDPNGSGALRL